MTPTWPVALQWSRFKEEKNAFGTNWRVHIQKTYPVHTYHWTKCFSSCFWSCVQYKVSCEDSKFFLVKIIEREIFIEPWLNINPFVIHNIFGKTKGEANRRIYKIIFHDFIDIEFFTDIIYTFAGVCEWNIIFEKAV